jgi:hypothetical protein
LFRDVVLDEVARVTLDSAALTWKDTERAWEAIEWCLSHDPYIGVPLTEGGSLRAFVYDGAKSLDQPDIEVIYEFHDNSVTVKNLVFSNAKATHAGRA